MSQIIVFITLIVMLALFISGVWRYDLVALLALLFLVVTGIIPAPEAFSGFGHPAVITVGAILVVSRGLYDAGAIDVIARWLFRIKRPRQQTAALTGVVALLSAFMNNIGALALLMPVGIQMARERDVSPSALLMPLAFASILGGLITMIGTPLNIIIATYRADAVGEPFGIFGFTRVGLFVAAAGILFLIAFSRQLLPQRETMDSREELFRIEHYLTELQVPSTSTLVGRPLSEVGERTSGGVQVVALERQDERIAAPSSFLPIQTGDIIVVEGSTADLRTLLTTTEIILEGHKELGEEAFTSDEISTVEVVVMPDSRILSRTVRDIDLRNRFAVNLLAVARRGQRLRQRLGEIKFVAGDVLLLQGRSSTIQYVLPNLGCLPLANRNLQFGATSRKLWIGTVIFVAALGLAAFGLLPIQISFASAAVMMILFGVVSLRHAYESIEWHILILLGAMIPIGHALETTGGADFLSDQLLRASNIVPPYVTLLLVLLFTMLLANTMNNKAAAVIIAPIAIKIARGLGASVDPFLMAVALGAEFVFLSPVGHQSNILVMGVGGYKFADYWRLGWPLALIVIIVSVPLLLILWPLGV
jgi:di/tricarboxylate transporter